MILKYALKNIKYAILPEKLRMYKYIFLFALKIKIYLTNRIQLEKTNQYPLLKYTSIFNRKSYNRFGLASNETTLLNPSKYSS